MRRYGFTGGSGSDLEARITDYHPVEQSLGGTSPVEHQQTNWTFVGVVFCRYTLSRQVSDFSFLWAKDIPDDCVTRWAAEILQEYPVPGTRVTTARDSPLPPRNALK